MPTPWNIKAIHINTPPASNPKNLEETRHRCEGNYRLSRGGSKRLNIDIQYSARTSEYTFFAVVRLLAERTPRDWQPDEQKSSFEIKGNGELVKHGGKVEFFESRFDVVEGTGRGVLEGLSGGGKMRVEMRKELKFIQSWTGEMCQVDDGLDEWLGRGSCTFEGMNEVGKKLM
ncbi:MAG: hypothetical protein Q9182_005681 [Xanthomendoza sp. 2 TL-2023]